MEKVDISVVVPTYNRSTYIGEAIQAFVQQDAPRQTFELIVVDNNSSDNTRAVVERCLAQNRINARYILECRQGVSYARNAGIAAAKGRLIAFADDDVQVQSDWIRRLQQAFTTYPDAVYLGGKVLPQWGGPLPNWIRANLAPLALQDYGDSPVQVDAVSRVCLLSANLACRREVFDTVGLFDTRTQRVKNSIGSLEDHEWQMRVWAAGLKGMYVPGVVVSAPVPVERLTKRYHRKWHYGHGRFMAMLRDPQSEKARWRWLDVPAHVYRSTASDLVDSFKFLFRGKQYESFRRQCWAIDGAGFILHRWTCCFGATAQRRMELENAKSQAQV